MQGGAQPFSGTNTVTKPAGWWAVLNLFSEIYLPDRRLGNEVVVHTGIVFLFVVPVLAKDEA